MILFTAAWRLFFPAAALFAGLALPLWLLLYAGQFEAMDDALGWHMHEMLWGYLAAALAGFLLTAIPNWTGRPVLQGAPLAGLFGLWLAGRVMMFFMPESLSAQLVTMAFLPLLGVIAAHDIIKADNKRNLVVVGLIGLMALAQALMLFGAADIGLTAGFATALVLMVLIGGRVTPAFSRNWLMKRGASALPPPFGTVDKVAMALSVATALVWTGTGLSLATGGLAALTALALSIRMARWQGWATRSEPLLLAQHAAYLWLPISMLLLALACLTDIASLSQVRHALGAGAVGTMTVIVMLRAALGHSGRPIVGNKLDWLLLGALHLGAALRIGSDWTGDPMLALNAAGLLWAAGFLLFLIRAMPIALAPSQ